MMTSTETLRARVDRALAKRVQQWAREHDTDVSETIRRALAKLLDEEDLAKRVAERRRKLQEAFDMGLFDPPKGGSVKPGGFK